MNLQLPLGYSLHIYDALDSTNDFIKNNSFPEESIVLAKSQSLGRGKNDTTWDSPKGNLHFSLMMKYDSQKHLGKISQLVFLVAVSIKQALEMEGIQYKWPNDIMLFEKKLAGILIESIVNQNIVIGIGVNVAHSPIDGATSLASHNIEIGIVDLLKKIIIAFEINKNRWLIDGDAAFEEIREEWNGNAFMMNEKVIFDQGDKKFEGIFKGIDGDGSLMLECNGTVRNLYSGKLCTI